MKKNIYFTSRISVISAIVFSLIFVVRPARAQSDTTSLSQSRISMKIIQKTNGDSTVLDTTMTFDGSFSDKEIREMTIKMKEQAKSLREQMEKLRAQMGDLRGFNFEFDMPEFPDFPEMITIPEIPDLAEIDIDSDSETVPEKPGQPLRIIHRHSSGQGDLNDVLGEIPMERVKSLSIKERKNGRKIVIEVDDTPSRRINKKVIIIRPDEKHRKARTYKIKPGTSGMMTI